MRRQVAVAVLTALTTVTGSTLAMAHKAKEGGRLAKIGPAPEFTLTSTDGERLSLGDFRGRVVAVSFICHVRGHVSAPHGEMAGMQKRLGPDFSLKVRFVSITVDPGRNETIDWPTTRTDRSAMLTPSSR